MLYPPKREQLINWDDCTHPTAFAAKLAITTIREPYVAAVEARSDAVKYPLHAPLSPHTTNIN